MTTRLGFEWKNWSHAIFSCPGKSGSYLPIHEISSRSSTERPDCGIFAASVEKASVQCRNRNSGSCVCRASWAAKANFV